MVLYYAFNLLLGGVLLRVQPVLHSVARAAFAHRDGDVHTFVHRQRAGQWGPGLKYCVFQWGLGMTMFKGRIVRTLSMARRERITF